MGDGYVQRGIFTDLTPAEKAYLLSHPWQIDEIWEAAQEALAESRDRFPGAGIHNGTGDAFRHCYWSAMLARDIGPEGALDFTTAHEGFSDNPAGERAMDLHNNAVGIGIGRDNPEASNAVLAALCNAALLSGELETAPLAPGEPYPY